MSGVASSWMIMTMLAESPQLVSVRKAKMLGKAMRMSYNEDVLISG